MSKIPDPILSKYPELTSKKLIESLKPRIERRVKMLFEVYKIFLLDWHGIYLNPHLLLEAISSAYCDTYRLKLFRNVSWVDDHKKAAFTMKWIARIRPIQVHSGAKLTQATLKINAGYAAYCGLTLLGVNAKDKEDDWWKKWLGNMIYLLHYHSPSAEFLSSEMFLFRTLENKSRTLKEQ